MGSQIEPDIGWASDTQTHPYKFPILLGLAIILGLALSNNAIAFATFITECVAYLTVLYSLLRVMACLSAKPAHIKPELRDQSLPHYTVLVPLYHEANMISSITSALSQLDYPREKLQILLICEECDPPTIAETRAHLHPPFELIIVPKGSPQTKPRALNFAMNSALGEIITIYDAEDRPPPMQLRQAAAAFACNPHWDAIQAPLDYYNADQNWLTRQFALEYAVLFHVWLPFLARLGLPFPLGGTSNHIRGLM